MNALYNHALKELSSIKRDVQKFESPTTATAVLQNNIAVSIQRLNQTLTEYTQLISQQPDSDSDAVAKARIRLINFVKERDEVVTHFNNLKQHRRDEEQAINRSELLHRNVGQHQQQHQVNDNPFHNNLSMQQGLNKEIDSLRRGNTQLDDILEMGRETFDNLVESNEIIRNFQRKIGGSLATLGVSQQTIHMVETRARQDKWLFIGGFALLVFFMWWLIRW